MKKIVTFYFFAFFATLFFSSCEKVEIASPIVTEDYGDEIQSRSPLYEVRGLSGGTAQDVCKLVIESIKFSDGVTVNFGTTVIGDNVIDANAAQILVDDIQEELFNRYGACYEVKLHLEIAPQSPSGYTFRWIFCIGDISGGSVVDEVTVTNVTGDCTNSPLSETNTYTFNELSDCAPFEHQFIAGCVFERISHAFVVGSPGLYWTDAIIRAIKTSDGTVYNMNVPLISGGVEVPGADAILADIFQQAVYASYGICFDSRAEFLVQELAFTVRLGLGDISPLTTVLDTWTIYVRASNGVSYTWTYNIGESSSPGSYVVWDQTCL